VKFDNDQFPDYVVTADGSGDPHIGVWTGTGVYDKSRALHFADLDGEFTLRSKAICDVANGLNWSQVMEGMITFELALMGQLTLGSIKDRTISNLWQGWRLASTASQQRR
jgi:hypothetical protein